jgi:hypothetical protein
MNEIAIEVLQKKRKELLTEKERFLNRINLEIDSIEATMETLSGKKVWQIEEEMKYDDENHDYIKGSFE